jgi:hypothetical protein
VGSKERGDKSETMPGFFGSADSKGVASGFFVSADSKGVASGFFVSADSAGVISRLFSAVPVALVSTEDKGVAGEVGGGKSFGIRRSGRSREVRNIKELPMRFAEVRITKGLEGIANGLGSANTANPSMELAKE